MHLHLVFRPPRLFVADARLLVTLEGAPLYDGGLADGFSAGVDLTPRRYGLETLIDGSMLGRLQRFSLALDAEGGYRNVPIVVATLAYNRIFGIFERVELASR